MSSQTASISLQSNCALRCTGASSSFHKSPALKSSKPKIVLKSNSGLEFMQHNVVETLSQGPTLTRTRNARRAHSIRNISTGASPTEGPEASTPAEQVVGVSSIPTTMQLLEPVRQGAMDRLAADKDFFFKLGVECSVDQLISGLANISKFGLNPLLWAATDLASAMLCHFTAIMNDVILVWYLAPVAGKKEDTKPKISHCFQDGEGVTLADRFGCIFDKFKLYGVVGVFTAVLAKSLILMITSQPIVLAQLVRTGIIGFVHLGVSSNLRYQTVNGLELLFSKVFPPVVARLGTIGVRTCNNFLGARIFLFLAGALS